MAYAKFALQAKSPDEEAEVRLQEVAEFEKLLARYPDWPEVLFRLASQRILVQQLRTELTGQLDQAVVDLKRLLQLAASGGPDGGTGRAYLLNGYFQLGRTYKHQGDTLLVNSAPRSEVKERYELAERAFRSMLALEPDRMPGIGEIVIMHQKLGDHDAAVREIRAHQHKLKDPKMIALSFEMLGEALQRKGSPREALTAFHAAVRRDERRIGSYLRLAALYRSQNQSDEAERILQRAVSVEPNFVNAHLTLGQLFLSQRDYEKAQRSYENALAVPVLKAAQVGMRPSKALFRNTLYYRAAADLAWVYLATGAPEKALKAIELAKTYRPMEAHLKDTLGEVYLAMGDTEGALRTFQDAAGEANHPSAHYHLAVIYADRRQTAKAREHLAQALGAEQPFYYRDQAETLLAKLDSAAP